MKLYSINRECDEVVVLFDEITSIVSLDDYGCSLSCIYNLINYSFLLGESKETIEKKIECIMNPFSRRLCGKFVELYDNSNQTRVSVDIESISSFSEVSRDFVSITFKTNWKSTFKCSFDGLQAIVNEYYER